MDTLLKLLRRVFAKPLPFAVIASDGSVAQVGRDWYITAQTTPAWADLALIGSAKSRSNGAAFFGKIRVSTWEELAIGLHSAAEAVDPVGWKAGFVLSNTDGQLNNLSGTSILTGLANNTDYPFVLLVNTEVINLFLQVAGIWKHLWMWYDTTASLYPVIGALDAVGFVRMQAGVLPSPFDSSYGIVTQRLTGVRGTGTVITHEANALVGWTVVARPSDAALFHIRRVDGNNCWSIYIYASGSVTLNEIVSGGSTLRRSAGAGSIANGQRMRILLDDTTIQIFADNTRLINYTSAANFKTATAGQIVSTGTGGSFSDFVSWPRNLNTSLSAVLNRFVR